ncbi:MAG TPA: hypothetical protein VGE12_10610 [Noviherbaspirillum sp.]
MRAAFYKSTRPGIAGLYNRLVRWWSGSQYSHVELVFSDGYSASASWMDGGVRFKRIDYMAAHWDFVDLPADLEAGARAWFRKHDHKPYDILGNVGFVWRPIRGKEGAFFCSEACAAALGIPEPWRFDPGTLSLILSYLHRNEAELVASQKT